ncbi:hypothetical protein [Myxococcus virescens]|uniref:hypothetical protein n=1 Tax=Myxococcus virescens TaxID=83456 RepID=UPI00115FA6DA|nr:hypothetical protein [Myxococcus virescens]
MEVTGNEQAPLPIRRALAGPSWSSGRSGPYSPGDAALHLGFDARGGTDVAGHLTRALARHARGG